MRALTAEKSRPILIVPGNVVLEHCSMRVFLASLFAAILFTTPAFCEQKGPEPRGIPDFTIRTAAPERAIYEMILSFHENALGVTRQRVVGDGKYEMQINSRSGRTVLLLRIVEEGLRSEGSYNVGDEKFYYEIVAPLILSLQEPEPP
jgi:hypothetical protein